MSEKVLVVDDSSSVSSMLAKLAKLATQGPAVTAPAPKSQPIQLNSVHDVAAALNTRDSRLKFKEGRTLPKGYQWTGQDVPGRGRAAQRRLKQMQKGQL